TKGQFGRDSSSDSALPMLEGSHLALSTPYLNGGPDVRYVGDEVCAGCHLPIAENYHRHPMGRSLAPVSGRLGEERYITRPHNPFEVNGQRYQVELRGGHFFHAELRGDVQDKEISRLEAEVQFELGSGSHGCSYLIDRDGYLFQSPISWYSQKRMWDISP